MAKVKIENVLESIDYGIKRALEDAVNRTIPNAQFDRNQLFREFLKAVGRKCSTWERIPDRFIESD
jgi:hypothetical protein